MDKKRELIYEISGGNYVFLPRKIENCGTIFEIYLKYKSWVAFTRELGYYKEIYCVIGEAI